MGTLISEFEATGLDTPGGRRITGVALVYGAIGASSAGPTRFVAGSVTIPADVTRVKLLLDHDQTDPVGYAESIHVEGDRLIATFVVGEGPRGDIALMHAQDKRRDGLSVGTAIDGWHVEGNTVVVTAATLNEVSLVSIPAFTDARIIEVRAHRKDEVMDREALLITCSNKDGAAAPAPAPAPAPVVTAAAAPAPVPAPAPAPVVTAAAPPAAAPPVVATTSPRADASLDGLVALTANYLATGGPAAGLGNFLTAALADLTPVSMGTAAIGEGPHSPQYVGELWEAAEVSRPMLDSIGVGILTALKMYGFRWATRPQVGRWAGNKTEVPTNTPTRERAEWEAQRFAGGWDVDRVFVDLPGGTDFIREVLVEATKDYAVKSEAYAVERLVAEATVIPTESTVGIPALLTQIGQDVAAVKGGRIDVVQMGSGRWGALLGMTEAQVPWWLRSTGTISLGKVDGSIGGIAFRVNDDLPDYDVIVLDKRAVKAQEVDPPIRVQALDVPRGGIDLGVFGYLAVGVTDARLVRLYRDTTP